MLSLEYYYLWCGHSISSSFHLVVVFFFFFFCAPPRFLYTTSPTELLCFAVCRHTPLLCIAFAVCITSLSIITKMDSGIYPIWDKHLLPYFQFFTTWDFSNRVALSCDCHTLALRAEHSSRIFIQLFKTCRFDNVSWGDVSKRETYTDWQTSFLI